MGFQHKKVKVGNVIIEIEGLVKHYGEVKAVDGVSFSVEKGETFGLLGSNGAGKTVPTFENAFPCQLELDCFSKTV